MKRETLQEYLARGGKITYCPPGPRQKEKKEKRVKSQGPDHDTRPQETAEQMAKEGINLAILPDSLKIALGIKR